VTSNYGADSIQLPKIQAATYAVMQFLSVCLSVRLSVTLVYCIETSKHILKHFSPSGRATILVFYVSNDIAIFGRGPHKKYVGSGWCVKKIAIFDHISEMIQNSHCYYGTPIGTHIRSIE